MMWVYSRKRGVEFDPDDDHLRNFLVRACSVWGGSGGHARSWDSGSLFTSSRSAKQFKELSSEELDEVCLLHTVRPCSHNGDRRVLGLLWQPCPLWTCSLNQDLPDVDVCFFIVIILSVLCVCCGKTCERRVQQEEVERPRSRTLPPSLSAAL